MNLCTKIDSLDDIKSHFEYFINESDFEEYLQKFIFTFYQILCTISTLSNFCKNATK